MRYIVWLKYNEKAARTHQETPGAWLEQGDGPVGPKTAERIAREIREDFGGIQTKVLPEGQQP